MTAILTATGWVWRRVGGSQVAHLVPPTVLRSSRSACARIELWDSVVELPTGLLDEVPLCQGCRAYGAAKDGPGFYDHPDLPGNGR